MQYYLFLETLIPCTFRLLTTSQSGLMIGIQTIVRDGILITLILWLQNFATFDGFVLLVSCLCKSFVYSCLEEVANILLNTLDLYVVRSRCLEDSQTSKHLLSNETNRSDWLHFPFFGHLCQDNWMSPLEHM